MIKTNLKLFEIQQLGVELNGYKENNQVIIPGLLNEKLNLVTKYWLTDLSNQIHPEILIIDKLRDELVLKYGESTEEGTIINIKNADDTINPKYNEFATEYNILLQEEKEIEHYEFTLEHLSNIESNSNFPILFKLIQ